MKNRIFKLLLFISIVFAHNNVQAQVQVDSLATLKSGNPGLQKKLKFGMGFGLNFVGGTNISLSPNLTYPLTQKVSVGAGLQFNYASLKNVQKTTTIGANALLYYTPVKKILTSLEFSELHVNRNLLFTNTKDEFWESALFVGLGYQLTPKIALGAKYNVLYNKNKSIYSSPVVPFININF
ncbi:MAG: hypothetical protein ACMG51_00085 [Ginsengibacter sp.]